MMSYEKFKEAVVDSIRDYLPAELKEADVQLSRRTKINQVQDAVVFLQHTGEMSISPILYLEGFYSQYLSCEDFEEVMDRMVKFATKAATEIPFDLPLNIQDAKNNLHMQLINTEQNADLLTTLPHREFENLSIVYRWMVLNDESGKASILLDYKSMLNLGMDEEQLFEAAKKCMQEKWPIETTPIREMIERLLPADMECDLDDEESSLYVLTNSMRSFGAVAMLDTDTLKKLAEQLGTDLYLIPSSIDEILAISTNEIEAETLAEMVWDINHSNLSPHERLSNQVYLFDSNALTVTQVTDMPEGINDEDYLGNEGMMMGAM